MLSSEEIWVVLTVHILGAIIWVGGTIGLAVVIWGLRRAFPNDPETVQRVASEVARAFAWVMWPALAVTVATGLVNLSWYVPPAVNWTGVPGGEWVQTAEGLVVLMAVVAGLHTFLLGPRIRRLRTRGTPPATYASLRGLNHALEGISLVAAVLVVATMVVLGTI